MKENKIYISHILDCIDHILAYTKEMNENSFNQNFMVQDAVVRNFEIIGEATKRLSLEFRNIHSNIPWKNMAGMRDKLIHNYFQVDLETVWDAITTVLPSLLIDLKKIHSQL